MKTEVFKRNDFLECEKKIPIIVAQENGKLVFEDLRELETLLVVGKPGTPRCPFVHSVVASVFLKCLAENVKLLLIDFAALELVKYDFLSHTKMTLSDFEVEGVVCGNEKCLYSLDRLAKEVVYRYHKIKETGAKDIEEFNEKSEAKMPYIVCIVEYAHKVKKKDVQIVQDYIKQISEFAKETGVCLVYSMNKVNTSTVYGEEYDLVSKEMLDCFSSKIIFRVDDDKKLLSGFDTSEFEHREHWFKKQNGDLNKFEMPFISDEEFSEIFDK